MLLGLLLRLWALDPNEAAAVVALGDEATELHLLRICWRESRCQRIGVHVTDERSDGWGGQVRLGHLDARCQAHGPRRPPYRWTTRGAWRLSAPAHWHYLPACYQPEWLDVPIVSAMVAARKIHRECSGARNRKRRRSWCGVERVRR